ncbi:MAG TPA: AsmA family protein [Gammaproteobacteria bacterium]|nr:AsmA family protein [Gammaproteobacteria bacterium]
MKKWLKRILLTLLVLVVVLAAGAVVFLSTFDPNARRDEIIALVQERTGRPLHINGEMELSFFPWLGFGVADIELGNAPGFEGDSFARVKRAEARVRIWPLLFGNIEVGEVVLDGLELNLARRKDGSTNWDDLLGPTAPATPSAPAATREPAAGGQAAAPLGAFSLGGLSLRKARIRWDDEQAGQHLVIDRFDLESGAIAPDTPFDLSLAVSGTFSHTTPTPPTSRKLGFELELDGRLQLDPGDGHARVRITGLKAEGSLTGNTLPGAGARGGKPLTVSLRLPSLDLDTATEHYRLEGLAVEAAGLALRLDLAARGAPARAALEGGLVVKLDDSAALTTLLGSSLPEGADLAALQGTTLTVPLAGSAAQTLRLADITLSGPLLNGGAALTLSGLPEAPVVEGRLRLAEFDARALLTALKLPPPPMRDADTLRRVALQTTLRYGDDSLALNKLKLLLDDSELHGKLRIRNLARPQIRTRLEVTRLDVDRYLPPPAGAATPATTPAPGAPADSAAAVPLGEALAPLRTLDLDAVLAVGELKVSGLILTRFNTTLRARQGRLALKPVTTALYGGRFAGDLGLQLHGDNLVLRLDGDLRGIDSGPLSRDLFQREWITGEGDVNLALTTRGADVAALRAALNGTARLSFRDGQITLLDTSAVAAYAKAKLKKQPTPPEDSLYRPSRYDSITASAQIKNGLLTNRDLRVLSPHATLSGSGTVDLSRETLDYRINLVYGKDAGKELEGLPVVVTLNGPLASPNIHFGWDDLIKAWVKRDAKRKIERERKAREDEIRERIRRKAKDLLKGL